MMEGSTDALPCGVDTPFLFLLKEVHKLGDGLFDGVEIEPVGNQEDQLRARGLDRGPDGLALERAEIIHDDEVA